MAIDSVNAATGSMSQQFTARPSQEGNQPRAERLNARPEQQARSEMTARPERNVEARRVEAPKPVVNAQGQKTGSIINTTA